MAGSGEKDAKVSPRAASGEERTTERRMLTASAVMQASPESTRDVAGEDFLFHLFRGSELLQDNRVLEAKEELEQALTLQPRDPKGQDLLAVVYFRIGHFPRAIQIYEQLKRENPRDPSLKLNLALCYLKTGQATPARAELEDVVRLHPAHKRAWGYLGLAYERLGDLDKAMSAFERAGHGHMARRIADKLGGGTPVAPRGYTIPVGSIGAVEIDAGKTGGARDRGEPDATFEELDAGEISFSLAEPATGSGSTANAEGSWREPGAPGSRRPLVDAWTVPPSADAVASIRAESVPRSSAPSVVPLSVPSIEPPPRLASMAPPRLPPALGEIARAARIAFPSQPGVAMHPSGVALVRLSSGEGGAPRPFAARLESIRIHGGALASEVLPRQARGKASGESFGGVASPLARVSGTGEIVLAPRPSHAIVAFTIGDRDLLSVREEALFGFELGTIEYENGKLALGDGDNAHVVQLRGEGAVLLELIERVQSLDVTEGHPVLVRRDALVAWSGRVAPRAVPPVEAPGGQRGLLSLAGDGVVFLSS